MSERFTERAFTVMALANSEALRFNHEYVGTEHILLGLVKEGHGVGANLLVGLGADLRTVRLDVERLIKSGPDRVPVRRLPLTPRAQTVIQAAIEESRALKDDKVQTHHLLLGLLSVREGVAAEVFSNLGITLERARAEVLKLTGADVEAPAAQPPATSDPALTELASSWPALPEAVRQAILLIAREALAWRRRED